MVQPVLELEHVSKSFGKTHALKAVSFDLLPGEVHVLAGENGAGKSTLIKILSGVYGDYGGEVRVDGKRVSFASPVQARRAGIATIHQELSLVPSLSITDNFELAALEPVFSQRARARFHERARTALRQLGLSLDPDTVVETLALGERQLVEIARALAESARVLVMDEPTSALSEPEALRLFASIGRLTAGGVGILYISHRMDEIYRIADRISVLCDGKLSLTEERRLLSPSALVRAMVGRDLPSTAHASRRDETAPPLLRVEALETFAPSPLRELSFELRPGEILGLAGLQGSGVGTALEALYGSVRRKRGRILLDGREFAPSSAGEALSRAVAFLPSDRARSVFPELSVLHNATLSSLARFSRFGHVDRARERAIVRQRVQELALKTPSLDSPARELSGGNQQKVALVRCLLGEPRLLLLDDPTRGVDIAARAEIHALLERLSERGVGIVLRSTDLEELCRLCDRVLVLFQGRLHAAVERPELTRERLAPQIMGAPS